MKKSHLFSFSIVLFSLIFMGALCSRDETNNINEKVAENIEAAEELDMNPFVGAWSWTTEEDGITITTTLIVNNDGSRTVPDVWVGTVDSTTSKVTGPDISAIVGLSEDFGIYRVEGDDISIDAANGTATFTGNFTSDTTAEGTWIHNQRGTGGTWTATKTE